jgi:hypothetical protein
VLDEGENMPGTLVAHSRVLEYNGLTPPPKTGTGQPFGSLKAGKIEVPVLVIHAGERGRHQYDQGRSLWLDPDTYPCDEGGSLFDCQKGTFSIVKVQMKLLKWVIFRLSNGYFFA